MNLKRCIFRFLALLVISFANLASGQEQYLADDFKVSLKPLGKYAIISFELKNDAKFYWRNPGELGLPTKFHFSKSTNLKSAEVFWPIPTIYERDNLASYVYKENADFVIKLAPEDSSQDIQLNANISFTICKKGCSNYDIDLSSIAASKDFDSTSGEVLEALNKAPHENGSEGLTVNKVEQEIIDGQYWLNIEFNGQETLLDPQIILDLPSYINFEPNNFNLISSETEQIIRIPFEINNKKYSKIKDQIYLNLVADNGHTVEYIAQPKMLNEQEANSSFMWILFAALIGGLILNVMPCVLPVLAIKILQLVKLSGQNKILVKKSLIAQAIGIIFTFICFALATYGLQFLGYQTGLGIHFQQPFYLITMILILSLIAINLFSEQELSLYVPQALVKIFHIKSQQDGIFGFFASGILSTLLAIPCTAPFVTIAVGFALSTDLFRMITVFAVMGIGMAFPYIVMAALPNMAKFLPKPGEWMISFKRILGLAIIATTLWLMYIVSTQLGYKAGITLFLLMLLVKFVITERDILSRKAKIFLFTILLGLSYFLPHNLYVEKQQNEILVESIWQEYEPQSISSLIEEGYVVVVNVSASWCSTCGLNNITTIENSSVINAIRKLKVIAMKADISKETSEEVANLMRSKSHHGIPLTLVYSKKNPNGVKLQTVLTPHILMSAIKEGLYKP